MISTPVPDFKNAFKEIDLSAFISQISLYGDLLNAIRASMSNRGHGHFQPGEIRPFELSVLKDGAQTNKTIFCGKAGSELKLGTSEEEYFDLRS